MQPGPICRTWIGLLKGVWEALATGFVYQSGDPNLDTLLSRGGMESMLNTIWLIMAAHGSFSSAGRAVQDLAVERTKNAPSLTAWSPPSSGGWIRNLQR